MACSIGPLSDFWSFTATMMPAGFARDDVVEDVDLTGNIRERSHAEEFHFFVAEFLSGLLGAVPNRDPELRVRRLRYEDEASASVRIVLGLLSRGRSLFTASREALERHEKRDEHCDRNPFLHKSPPKDVFHVILPELSSAKVHFLIVFLTRSV